MDLCSSSSAILTPESEPSAIPTGVYGPIPKGTVGLLLGRSSTSLQGYKVIPGIIDEDYEGEIKIMLETPAKVLQIEPGQRIAQLILLPRHINNSAIMTQQPRGEGGFGSSNVYWVEEVGKSRPLKTLWLNGKKFLGLLDTGADVTCIAAKDWPQNWPLEQTNQRLVGVGAAQTPARSTSILKWKDEENHHGLVQPYVLPHIPLTLWGRDILAEMGVMLFAPNEQIKAQLLDMGFDPTKGLGKEQQGRTDPIIPLQRTPRAGLGYEQNL